MSEWAICPNCGHDVRVKRPPADSGLLAHMECVNRSCPTGPIYTVDVSSAYERMDADPVLRAMRELAASIEEDAEMIAELFDFIKKAAGR